MSDVPEFDDYTLLKIPKYYYEFHIPVGSVVNKTINYAPAPVEPSTCGLFGG